MGATMLGSAATEDVWCDLTTVGASRPEDGWRAVVERTYNIPFDLRPAPARGEHFHAGVARRRLGQLSLIDATWGRGSGRRRAREIAATEQDLLVIIVMLSGRQGVEFDGHAVVLSPGQVILIDSARQGTFTCLGTVVKRALTIPRERLRLICPGYESVVGRPLAAGDPAARLIAGYLESLAPLATSLSPVAREAAADAALELARAALSLGGESQPRSLSEALLTSVRRHIEDHLRDPDLGPAAIARAHAISVRTLNRVFETAGESATAVIRERRLSRCRADVLAQPHEAITAIAYRWGFRDMSHFSRLFRRRFGVSARELQAEARRGAQRPALVADRHDRSLASA